MRLSVFDRPSHPAWAKMAIASRVLRGDRRGGSHALYIGGRWGTWDRSCGVWWVTPGRSRACERWPACVVLGSSGKFVGSITV